MIKNCPIGLKIIVLSKWVRLQSSIKCILNAQMLTGMGSGTNKIKSGKRLAMLRNIQAQDFM